MKVIFGGTFNPVHNGHLLPLVEVQQAFGLTSIGFMPNRVSPFKQSQSQHMTTHARDTHRLNMLSLALAPYPDFYVEPYEIQCDRVSFTAMTIAQWLSDDPHMHIVFIMGADSYDHFHRWHQWEYVLANTSIIVLPRDRAVQINSNLATPFSPFGPGDTLQQGRIYLANTPLLPISSTAIRDAIQNSVDIAEFIPQAVLNYIQEHHLYHHQSR